MAAAKQIMAATADLLLNDIAASTMVLYTTMTTNPANAAAITGVIGVRSGLTTGDYTVTSGSNIQVKAGSAITALTPGGTATCIILKTGTTNTDGVIKAITTGSTVLTTGQSYTPSAFTITLGTPT